MRVSLAAMHSKNQILEWDGNGMEKLMDAISILNQSVNILHDEIGSRSKQPGDKSGVVQLEVEIQTQP